MKKISIFIGVIIALMCELSIAFINFIPKPLEENGGVLLLKKVIYREMITVNSLLKKFDNVLIENNLGKIDLEYLTVIDDTYYIGLFQDIILFISPLEYNNINEDIVYQTGIIVDEDTVNLELALLYYEYLIKANNEFVFNANELVNLVVEGNLVEENNGLILGAVNDNYEINLFIERKYNS